MSSLRYCYRTIEFGTHDIHLKTLRNKQEFEDAGGVAEKIGITSANWSLFGVVWESSEILARLMLDFDIKGKRILEIGCGIALPSMVLNHRSADITSTDYHPEVEKFLLANTRLNEEEDIPFIRTGWADGDCDMGEFELIIGSDLLYERGSPKLLSKFIDRLCAKHCEIILVDPGRGYHANFTKEMIGLGYSHRHHAPLPLAGQPTVVPKGKVLYYNR